MDDPADDSVQRDMPEPIKTMPSETGEAGIFLGVSTDAPRFDIVGRDPQPDVPANRLIAVAPGNYSLRQSDTGHVFAEQVVVRAGNQTSVQCAVVQFEAPSDLAGQIKLDLYDTSNGSLAGHSIPSNRPVLVTRTRHRVLIAGSSSLSFGEIDAERTSVFAIAAGTVTVTAPPGVPPSRYDLRGVQSSTPLSTGVTFDAALLVPAGVYRLVENAPYSIVYASQLRVESGQSIQIFLGAVRYLGSDDYDVLTFAEPHSVVAEGRKPLVNVAIPAGRYQLRNRRTGEIVAPDVVVQQDEITEVP